jgi:hypothetical protein
MADAVGAARLGAARLLVMDRKRRSASNCQDEGVGSVKGESRAEGATRGYIGPAGTAF